MDMPKKPILDVMLDALKIHPINIFLKTGEKIEVTKITKYITATDDDNRVIGITVRYRNGKKETISPDLIEKVDF